MMKPGGGIAAQKREQKASTMEQPSYHSITKLLRSEKAEFLSSLGEHHAQNGESDVMMHLYTFIRIQNHGAPMMKGTDTYFGRCYTVEGNGYCATNTNKTSYSLCHLVVGIALDYSLHVLRYSIAFLLMSNSSVLLTSA